jgi:hypothetical protein
VIDWRKLPHRDWISIGELHRISQIPMRTLRRWAEDGSIPASKRGTGRWSIDVAALKEAFEEILRSERTAFETALEPKDSEVPCPDYEVEETIH